MKNKQFIKKRMSEIGARLLIGNYLIPDPVLHLFLDFQLQTYTKSLIGLFITYLKSKAGLLKTKTIKFYKMNNKQLITRITIFFVAIVIAGCGASDKKVSATSGGPGSPPPGPMPFKVAPVYYGAATLKYSFPATIQGEQNVEIRPKVDGFIEKIFVDEGAVVHKGQPLFQLNNPQYEQAVRSAAAAVKIAEADVMTATMNVDKVRPLVEKNIISKYELESNEYTLQSKNASLASAKADLVNAKVNVGYTYITSPSDGIIGAIPYKQGSLVSSTSGSPLTTVYNTNKVYAYFALNEKQLLGFSRQVKGTTLQNKLATTQDVILILADGTEYPQKGRITTATGLINTETGSANFRATFPNSNGLIRSGSSATIEIPVTIDTAILVPQAATFDQQGKKFVYKLVGSDSVTNVAIDVDEVSIGDLYVVKKGLSKDDRIVIEGVNSLQPGVKIAPVPAPKDSVYTALSQ